MSDTLLSSVMELLLLLLHVFHSGEKEANRGATSTFTEVL